MAENPRVRTEIRDFPGLINNQDATDIPRGAAQVMVNVTTIKLGQLQTRGGLLEVTFEN